MTPEPLPDAGSGPDENEEGQYDEPPADNPGFEGSPATPEERAGDLEGFVCSSAGPRGDNPGLGLLATLVAPLLVLGARRGRRQRRAEHSAALN